MDSYSYVGNGDVNAMDELYQQYQQNPDSVDVTWRKFFEGFEFALKDYSDDGEGSSLNMNKEFKVINLINGYRSRGHLFTKTNPVRTRRTYEPTLAIENFELEQSDMNTVFQAGSVIGIGPATLANIVKHLEETYCQSIGIEYVYMREPKRLDWFKNMIEIENRYKFTSEDKKYIFGKLNEATMFEDFLQKKYVGQKRFSVEGSEAIIPAFEWMMRRGADQYGVEEFVMGMAHRGRINTLVNLFGKDAVEVFNEFDGKEFEADESFDGDVKYHLGYSTDVELSSGKKLHMTLAPNPSHLEAVDPVVEGIARAKLDQYLDDKKKIVPILVHGDAAIAGQGVVYEVVQMAGLDGYGVGGTIHVVINNQVGFTTNYLDARTSTYCTDVAKTTLCPVFHVNGDDVEAVVQTFEMALRYRQEFNRDVFIDVLSYRKYGHNEGDEPKFTQPKLYDAIKKHPNPRTIYLNQLITEGVMDKTLAEQMAKGYQDGLEGRYDESKKDDKAIMTPFLENTWKGMRYANGKDFELASPNTGVDKKKVLELGEKMSTLPEGKKYFRKIKKIFDDRLKQIKEDRLDWGTAENLAYATLLDEGYDVRISGQDVERGTFSHRHAVVKTEDTEEEVIPLQHLNKNQGDFSIYNSLLSEYGVLGYEYGYSLASPNALTIWEAQFGDFFNGAQIMIDQFISAGEDKWMVQSGLTMLLPHGYEGMGAEHSSARIERFLQMSADLNWQVCNATTPANYFHLLRRQLHREFRKPLVVFTPKMLLRYPKAVSTVEDLTKGGFQEVIDDTINADKVSTLVLCSGKIYYELLEKLELEGVRNEFAVVRVEQLYPMPKGQINDVIAKYKNADRVVWAQEEPANMGPWWYMRDQLDGVNVEVAARDASSAPAAGSSQLSNERKERLFQKVIGKVKV